MIALLALATAAAPPAGQAALAEPAARPRWGALPPDPRAQTDYTAYTLELGEIEVGLARVGFSFLPGVQLTTQPLLLGAGIGNAALKVDLLQVGPLDGAINGALGYIQTDALRGVYVTAGGNMSLILHPMFSVHGGCQWTYGAAIGMPDVSVLTPVAPSIAQLSQGERDAIARHFAYEVRIETTVISGAIDLRFNRRDSVILQGRTAIWAWTELPAWLASEEDEAHGFIPLEDAFSASLAWQFHWRNVDLRLGIGASSIPGAWVTESFDLAYRFGGPTRKEYKKNLVAWRAQRTAHAR